MGPIPVKSYCSVWAKGGKAPSGSQEELEKKLTMVHQGLTTEALELQYHSIASNTSRFPEPMLADLQNTPQVCTLPHNHP